MGQKQTFPIIFQHVFQVPSTKLTFRFFNSKLITVFVICVDKKVVSFIGGTNNLILTIRVSKNVSRKTPIYTVTKFTLHRRKTIVHFFVVVTENP